MTRVTAALRFVPAPPSSTMIKSASASAAPISVPPSMLSAASETLSAVEIVASFVSAIAADALTSASTITPDAIAVTPAPSIVTSPETVVAVTTPVVVVPKSNWPAVAFANLLCAIAALVLTSPLTIVPSAIIADVTVPVSATVTAVPEIFVLSIAADALMSSLTMVPFAIIRLVIDPVSPVVTTVPVTSGKTITLSDSGSVTAIIVSKSLAVAPSKTMLFPFIFNPANVGLALVATD